MREPRIADAAVFSADDSVQIAEVDLAPDAAFSSEDNPEAEKLRKELAEKEADSLIDDLKRAGKLAPAAEVFARAILRSGDDSAITFGDRPTPVNQIFRWFLDSQPKVIEFSELATAEADSTDEPEVFAKLGVTTRQVERHRSR